MKKAIIAVIAVAAMMVSVAQAEISGSISTKMLSAYVANNGVVLHDDTVQQTDFFVLLPHGFYADLWVSLPHNGGENPGKEIDGTLGWSGNMGTTGLIADLGVSYFGYIDLSRSDDDMVNPYAKISKDFAITENQTVTPYIKIETPFPVEAEMFESGTYTYLGIKHAWQTTQEASLSQDIYAVYDNGVYGLENGWIGKYTVAASIQLGKGIALDFSLSVFDPLTEFTDRKTETITGLSPIKFAAGKQKTAAGR